MTIETRKIEKHWNYLLAIENDLTELSRYVEFDEKNFECFSIEIARILLTSAAEVDVVCKQICRKIKPMLKAKDLEKLKIHGYRDTIKPVFPGVPQFEVSMLRFGLKLHPWEEWSGRRVNPRWWCAYNKVKHQRDSEYEMANLKNALNAVAGLFVMVLYLYKEKAKLGELVPSPQLLHVGAEHWGGMNVGGLNSAPLMFFRILPNM